MKYLSVYIKTESSAKVGRDVSQGITGILYNVYNK